MNAISMIVVIICVGMYFINNVYQNKLSSTLEGRLYPLNLFQVCWMTVAVTIFISYKLMTGTLHFSPVTLGIASISGLLQMACNMLLTLAMGYGPLSMTILIFSMYIVIPPALSIVFLGEKASVLQFVAMILIVIVIALSNFDKNELGQRRSLKWWILSVLSAVGWGMISFLMRIHQSTLPGEEVQEYTIIAYVVGILTAILLFLINRKRELGKGKEKYHFNNRVFVISVVMIAISSGGINMCNLFNASRIPAIIQYPVTQLLTLMFTVMYSVLALKNKLSKISKVCMAIGIIAIVLINF